MTYSALIYQVEASNRALLEEKLRLFCLDEACHQIVVSLPATMLLSIVQNPASQTIYVRQEDSQTASLLYALQAVKSDTVILCPVQAEMDSSQLARIVDAMNDYPANRLITNLASFDTRLLMHSLRAAMDRGDQSTSYEQVVSEYGTTPVRTVEKEKLAMEEKEVNVLFEVDDMDADIKRKQDLIATAKELVNLEDDQEKIRQASLLRKEWKRIHYWESEYEEDLRNQFEEVIDVLYEKQRELEKEVKEKKEALIEQAKQLAGSDEYNKGTAAFKELMTQWKAAGNTNKAEDDRLWEQFNGYQQAFFDKKRAYFQEARLHYAQAAEVKAKLVEEAKALSDSQQWQKTSQLMNDLMERWKEAGHAGKGKEDALWNEFRAARQVFFDARSAHYENLHAQRKENYEKKQALVAQAKAIAEVQEYSKENTAKMKDLGVQWKAIGTCERDKEDSVWEQFRAQMDDYFSGLKTWHDSQNAQWKNRMEEVIERKRQLIENQKRTIARLEDDLNGLISSAGQEDIENQIADRESFIAQLEDEIADIEKKL